jgi:hypothetical protein
MPYPPKWWQLAEARARVVDAAKQTATLAETDICRAMADGEITVRATYKGRIYVGRSVCVPPHLERAGLDWDKSRPTERWPIRILPGQHYFASNFDADHAFKLIELLADDVVATCCQADPAPIPNAAPPKKQGWKVKRARQATKALWPPNGKPQRFAVKPDEILADVRDWFETNPQDGDQDIGDATILRAAGRKK